MFDHPSIHSGGESHISTFTRIGTGDYSSDDRICGPSSMYIAAYPVSRLKGQAEWDIELHQESREGPLRVIIKIGQQGEYKLILPDRPYEATVSSGAIFPGPFGQKTFSWRKGGSLMHKQFACWEVVEGKPRRKAAKWKKAYETGEGVLYINQASLFIAFTVVRLAS
ncbi:hypothetical protein JCM11641_003641 [Rhodosporidiobolus odoratus]